MPDRPIVMLAQSARTLPTSDGWSFEPKMDGFRAVLNVTSAGRVSLISRHSKRLDRYFPDIVEAASQLPPGLRLDGELVVPRGGGVDFTALQGRIHPAEKRIRQLADEVPAAFVAFDLLTLGGNDMRDQPYRVRRDLLVATLTGVSSKLGVMPATTDQIAAQVWLTGQVPGIEGVVAKRMDQRYRPGIRGWHKVRLVNTIEAVVAGITGTIEQSRLAHPGTTRPARTTTDDRKHRETRQARTRPHRGTAPPAGR